MVFLMEACMKKSNLFIIISIVLLLGILVATYFINRDDIEVKRQLNKEAIFEVVYQGEVIASYDMEEISKMGEVTFNANLKSSGKDPVAHQYTGVLLKTILENAGLTLEDKSSATVIAIDGYATALTMEKLMDDSNVYLSYFRDGTLIGTKEEGGDGPYQLIISKDPFSQFWVKYAYQVELID